MYLCVARPTSEYVPIGPGTLYLNTGAEVKLYLVPIGEFPITRIEVRNAPADSDVWFERLNEVSH